MTVAKILWVFSCHYGMSSCFKVCVTLALHNPNFMSWHSACWVRNRRYNDNLRVVATNAGKTASTYSSSSPAAASELVLLSKLSEAPRVLEGWNTTTSSFGSALSTETWSPGASVKVTLCAWPTTSGTTMFSKNSGTLSLPATNHSLSGSKAGMALGYQVSSCLENKQQPCSFCIL